MLKNMKISVRLGLGFGLVFLIFTAVSFIIINRMEFSSNLTNMMYKHPLTVSNAVLRVDGNIVRIHRSMKDVVLAKNDAEISEAYQLVNRYEEEVYKDFEIITERFLGDKKMYEDAMKAFVDWKPIRDEVIDLMRQGKTAEAAAITKGKGAKHVDKLNMAMLALLDFAQNKAKSFREDTLSTRTTTLSMVYILVIVTIVVGITFMIFFTRSITQPLSRLMEAVTEIRQGNLDKKILVESNDEIGQLATAFNGMASELKESYTGLEEKVHKRTEELDRANEELKKEINERKQAEAELMRNHALLAAIVEGTTDAIFVKDAQGRYLIANTATLRGMGRSQEEIIGKDDFAIFPPETAQQLKIADQSIIASGEAQTFEETTPLDDETLTWLSTKAPYRDHDGNIIGTIGVSHNITKLKQAEKERENLIAELEVKNTELERFTYTVSHDLKSPLITIKGFLGLIEEDAISGDVEQLKSDMSSVSNAADKMQQLLEELLELSRIGRLVNPSEEIPLGGLVNEAIELVSGRISQRGVRVEVAQNLPSVYADRVRLREVLENLIDNAVKFMGEQSDPHVEIGVRYDGDERVFYVKDNGIGIAPRYQERVFDLFERFDANMEGSGVGLATVKRIVEFHKGRIWVESEGVGKGATFCFTLADKES